MYRHGAWHDTVLMGILADEFFAKHGRTDDGKVLDPMPKAWDRARASSSTATT